MAQIIPPKVNPGDLITANYINSLIDALSGLDQRVTKLESIGSVSNPVIITGFTATQPVHVGDQIEIDGAGFLVPAILNQVTIGGAQVTNFSTNQSSATKLLFIVPAISGVTSGGVPFNVTVTNSNGSATSTFQIVVQSASTAPTGRSQLLYSVPPVMPIGQLNITAGQSYVFAYTLTAFTDRAGTFAFTPSATGAGWSATLLDPSPVQVAANTTATMRVQVTAAAGSSIVTLSVVETTPGSSVTPGTAQLTITAGSPPPTPETRVRVSLSGAQGGAAISGAGVTFTKSKIGGVTFNIVFTQGGDYSLSAAMRNPTGWTSGGIDIPNFHVNQPTAGGTANQSVNVIFTAAASVGGLPGASATDLVLTVTNGADINVASALPVTVS
ncbi:MAG TPA: IPT/TIG domain-containing protein [Bryobacteraceae bacterium]|nr:IPT/TIG domain-containing protein [Bryobacteraceae bacterium]